MEIGRCECPAGMSGAGAPCEHQFLLWTHRMYKSTNVLPDFSAEDRQKFGIIALGEALDISMYEPLRNVQPNVTLLIHRLLPLTKVKTYQ